MNRNAPRLRSLNSGAVQTGAHRRTRRLVPSWWDNPFPRGLSTPPPETFLVRTMTEIMLLFRNMGSKCLPVLILRLSGRFMLLSYNMRRLAA